MIHCDYYFSIGLKPPTRERLRWIFVCFVLMLDSNMLHPDFLLIGKMLFAKFLSHKAKVSSNLAVLGQYLTANIQSWN